MIRGAVEIRDAYRSTAVAQQYVKTRFREPLGALLHDRQVDAVVTTIQTTRPATILEIAPGPARVTVDVAKAVGRSWTIVDASAQMLGEARERLAGGLRWRFVQGDAFALPTAGPFDLVYSFRLIRHFERAERRRLYKEVARTLASGGLFIFDAVNRDVSAPIRAADPASHVHYDALLTREELTAELADADLEIVECRGVQHRYSWLYRLQTLVAPRSRRLARAAMEAVEALPGGQPLEWIVVCRRA